MRRPRLFAEVPAGLAGVSLRLHGGPHCRPPISRMGSKVGYAGAILGALGLRSGSGADAYLWVEADDDVRGLLAAYPDPAKLREIAEIIRGWKDEEPRALWERLRAEREMRKVSDVPAWMTLAAWTKGNDADASMYMGPDRPSACHPEGWTASITSGGLATRCDRLADAAGAREVAAWAWVQARSVLQKGEHSGYMPGGDEDGSGRWVVSQDGVANAFARTSGASSWPPVAILATPPEPETIAQMLGTPGDLSDVVVYMDPDYVGTTGYRHTFPRPEVVRLAIGYAALGATVAVSEAVPVEELTVAGWDAIDIAGERRGQKRTFSREKGEWVTMSRAPTSRPAVQSSMFGIVVPHDPGRRDVPSPKMG